MQRYNIFNKYNRICILNEQSDVFFHADERVIECTPETINSIDFRSFFEDDCRQNIIIFVKSLPIEQVFFKVTEGLVFVQAAGGLVRNQSNDYLFIYRAGHWDLPKGHREQGEALDFTATREVEEETGISCLRLGEKIGVTYHTYIMKGRREIKETHWYDMFSDCTDKLTPQKEEGITKALWISKAKVQTLGQKIYPSLRHLLSTIGFSFDKTL